MSFKQHLLPIFIAGAMFLPFAVRSGAQVPERQPLSLEAKISLGNVRGRIDHMAIDPVRNRLFVAELGNDSVGVIDLKSRRVMHRITGLTEPQGVGYEPSSDTLYVANAGDGSVRLYQAEDFKETGRIALGDDADNIRIDADAHRVLVGYGSGAIATIDGAKKTKITEFAVSAHPEGFQFDRKTNRIFVNVPRANAIVVIDGSTGKQPATWPMTTAGGNFPMAFDDDGQRVLVAFRSPAKLGAFSAADGKNLASVDLCGDSDDLFVDAKRHRAYASCGQGFVDVFDLQDAGYQRLVRVPTVSGARTSYFAPSIDRFFLAVRSTSAEPAAIWVFRPAP
jgi:YVTN family beta-propeller protein